VFRAFYHYSRAVQRGEADDLVLFLAEHAKLLGIVKREASKTEHERRIFLERNLASTRPMILINFL
jgi:hypothetical protein